MWGWAGLGGQEGLEGMGSFGGAGEDWGGREVQGVSGKVWG